MKLTAEMLKGRSAEERAEILSAVETKTKPPPGYTAIYGLTNWATGHLGYVGKTIDAPRTRLKQHCYAVKRGSRKPVECWIRANRPVDTFVIEIVPDRLADDAEQFWIRSFLAIGAKLANVVHGPRSNRAKTKPRKMSDARAARELEKFIAKSFSQKKRKAAKA